MITSGTMPPQTTPRRGLSLFIYDLLSLVDLQGKLLVHDLHSLKSGSTPALLMVCTGLILGFASLPVLMLGVAWLLTTLLNWPLWMALCSVGGLAGALPAAVLLAVGWRLLQKRVSVLGRTTSELTENVEWLKRRMKQTFDS